jgi:hypothetical protein
MTENAIDEEKWYKDEVMGLCLGPHEIGHKLLVETQYVRQAAVGATDAVTGPRARDGKQGTASTN